MKLPFAAADCAKSCNLILDNRAIPWMVHVKGKTVELYEALTVYGEKATLVHKGAKLNTFNAIKVFPPQKGPSQFEGGNDEFYPNNSLLLHIGKDEYVFIGERISKFRVEKGDVIEGYFSPIGNNLVPYCYAVGKDYVYLLIEEERGKIRAQGQVNYHVRIPHYSLDR